MLRRRPWLLLALLVAPLPAAAAGAGAIVPTLLALTLILVVAKLGGHLAIRLQQPAVLGELVAGVIAGNLALAGFDGLTFVRDDPTVAALADLGVILLLFEVGLESTVAQMARVGITSLVVAVLGVVAPMLLGFGVGALLLPEQSWYVHLFLGAALSATSVGITARVFQDLGQSQSPEARIVLGAAVIDDVLGLIVLAAVAGIIEAANAGVDPTAGPILLIIGKAVLFLGGALLLGGAVVPRLFRGAARLRGGGVLLGVSLAFCFFLSWAAAEMGLAPIVGAFAAGLVLESAHYQPFTQRGEYELEKLIHPVGSFLAPVFFVLMGFKVDLSAFTNRDAVLLALALTVAAIIGKQVCSLGVLVPGVRRLPVGFGMIPRGEVGLIFASIGHGLRVDGAPVVDDATFGAIVIMVMLTTLAAPPLLTWSMRGRAPTAEARREDAPPAE